MIQKFEIGDKVEVLDEAISGRVVAIKNEVISVETNDGFMMTFFCQRIS